MKRALSRDIHGVVKDDNGRSSDFSDLPCCATTDILTYITSALSIYPLTDCICMHSKVPAKL